MDATGPVTRKMTPADAGHGGIVIIRVIPEGA